MQEENPGTSGDTSSPAPDASGTETSQPRRRRAASRAAGPPAAEPTLHDAGAPVIAAATSDDAPASDDGSTPAKKTARKAAAKKTAAKKAAKKAPAKRTARRGAAVEVAETDETAPALLPAQGADPDAVVAEPDAAAVVAGPDVPATVPDVAAIAAEPVAVEPADAEPADAEPAAERPAPRKRSRSRKAAQRAPEPLPVEADTDDVEDPTDDLLVETPAFAPSGLESAATEARASAVLFQPPTFSAAPLFAAPDPEAAQPARGRRRARPEPEPELEETAEEEPTAEAEADAVDDDSDDDGEGDGTRRRRRRRGGRGRRRRSDDADSASDDDSDDDEADEDRAEDGSDDDAHGESDDDQADSDDEQGGSRRRRRRRRRRNDDGDEPRPDDPPNTVVRVREARELDDEVTSVKGSTRLEAKKQRRREGREAGRRRPPILSEAEFLARREAVDRVMAVRQSGDLTQIAVLEDDVLVEHYVSRASQQSLIGNVYLGRVQNVLPAMEAAFVDIGRGRNAVLYAGEVDWTGLGKNDGPKRIEDVLKSGQSVLVQVTKDPIGHKGARLTSQVSLPGRYVVYVPGGSMNGISRKLPDTERTRLKKILKQVVPEDAGVIVRTAAEGASEEELTNDVGRLQAEWEALEKKAASGNAPQLLHGEPDLAIKVVRDLFNEDFSKLVVSGDRAWDTIEEYVSSVAGSLRERVEKWTGTHDVFAAFRIDEQIAKAMDRKVWLPSGGSLVIDRTEAMTVVDVNTGKFTGSGGNLEETVTKNNLEAAEEIVRQLRLRDIGGIIVIDFIDMVLEANRDLVLRRLVECLGRDRTKHQVAEVTSLGLVQMTRKRIGTGLLEAFSEPCPHCKGRGLLIHAHPVESGNGSSNGAGSGSSGSGSSGSDDGGRGGSRSERRGRRRKAEPAPAAQPAEALTPKLEASASPGEASPADLMPVGNGNGGNGHGEHHEAPTSDAAAPTTSETEATSSSTPPPPPPPPPAQTLVTGPAEVEAAATGQPAETTEPARPRRTRRRAERPAGSPVP